MEKICVAVRVRPPVAVSQEPSFNFNGTFWRVEENHRISLHKAHGTPIPGISYAFDHIFDETCTNDKVYDLLTKDIMNAAVEGFNGTAFAYGQTSSGKTFTMNGSENDPGIIPRAVKDIFKKIQLMSNREFLVRVSYMEIYNEEINDLLAVENQKLQIHESLERGVFVAGLKEEIVSNAEEVLKLIEAGEVNRHFGETNMNVRSSRSHTIFRMVIESKATDANSNGDHSPTDTIRVSVLNLVDLAGSERIAKTGADGMRLKEGKHINKSLMTLGNVINKLSEGSKQRGHIPYRDSKLTRILQPALGGNAKTSIICTIAPEEIHVEETKGTLQFASRAKRITNCVQVNEILTDAALLKRQKLEIEELRKKLQGSHAEILEREILKLRNDLLKNELEREKLEIKLEEERKSQKEREQCIREQQMKIENLSTLVSMSNCDGDSSQLSLERGCVKRSLKEDCNGSASISQGDNFRTPFKGFQKSFVAKRSNYSAAPDYSPLPDTFSNIADEDTWLKMNKGYVADLDSLQITPARKVQSFPTSDCCSNDEYEEEIQKLRKRLESADEQRHEIERKHADQVLFNEKLMTELCQLKQEAQLTRQIPQLLSESVGSLKGIFEDALSAIQCSASDDRLSTTRVLSGMMQIGDELLKTLDARLTAFSKSDEFSGVNNVLLQEQEKMLYERVSGVVTSLVSSEGATIEIDRQTGPPCVCGHKGYATGDENVNLEKRLSVELNSIKERCHSLEKEVDRSSHLLEVSKERYDRLEREFQLMNKERDSLLQMVSESSERLVHITKERENAVKSLNAEAQKRKGLEEKINLFAVAFASRQGSLTSFHREFKSKLERLRAQTLTSLPNPSGFPH